VLDAGREEDACGRGGGGSGMAADVGREEERLMLFCWCGKGPPCTAPPAAVSPAAAEVDAEEEGREVGAVEAR